MEKDQRIKLEEKFEYWKQNPIEFIKEFWPSTYLWDKLEEICNSVRDNRGTVAPSAHGVGKSFISAKIILWWLFTHFPSKVITTAPTWQQVESILWGEIRSSILMSKIPLVDQKCVLNTEIKIAPDWFAKGISTTERVEQREFGSTKFQGFHSPNLLIVMDEAPGVEHSIHIALETLATGSNNRLLKIGNPTSPTGSFYDNCYSNLWKKILISAYDHPNVKEKREIVPGAVTIEWIERVKEEWGENSPLYKAKVLGEFPDETEDTLIPLSWLEKAVYAEVEPTDYRVLGVDVARFGDDKSIVCEIKNNSATFIHEKTKEDTMTLVGRITNIAENYKHIYVDGTGVGGGVVDRLKEVLNSQERSEKLGHRVREINNGGKSELEPRRFFNIRAEMYWHLRERLRPDGEKYLKLRIPDDDELKAQLAGIKIGYASDGRLKIESKDDMKSRGLKSPDKADALCLASWANKPNKPQEIHTNPIYKEFFDLKRQQNNNRNLDFLQ
jgi:hypothetical protein